MSPIFWTTDPTNADTPWSVHLLCDFCNGRIDSGGYGNVSFCSEDRCEHHQPGAFYVEHKDCTRMLERAQGHGCMWGTMEFRHFAALLLHRLKLNQADIERAEDELKSMGLWG